MLVRLAAWCYERRRLVLMLWLVALVGSLALSSAFGSEFRQDYFAPGTESKQALDVLREQFPQRSGDTLQVVFRAPDGVRAPATRARIDALLTDLADDAHVAAVVSPFSERGAFQVSRDGTIAYADVELDDVAQNIDVESSRVLVDKVRAAGGRGLQVEAGGQTAAVALQGEVGSEGVGFVAAALILLFTFGSLVAMGLPLMTALFGIGISAALGAVMRNVVDVPDWAPSIAAMVGIGVGIDYALFIVTRYRSSLSDGDDPRAATVTALATAGRAVVFAGCTVVISLLGILLMGVPFAPGVAFTATLAVLVVMVASVTLLPAVLGFTGRNIERLHVPFVGRRPDGEAALWFRWSRFVQRRPWPAAIAGLVALVLLSLPFFSLRFGFPDASNDPTSFTTRRAYDLLTTGFGQGFNGPFVLTVQGDVSKAGSLVTALRSTPGVASVSPPQPNAAGDTAVIQLVPTTSPQAKATEDLVDRLRDEVVPPVSAATGLDVHVSGVVAGGLDSNRFIVARLPLLIGGVVLLSFLLLLVVFRSVLVAVKAAVMNLLSIAAAYGVVGLAVSGGWFGQLIGIPEPTPVPAFIPMMMFAILFGLSMDYEVFLLSRIREEYERTGDNALAVADGLAKTARVITAAAAIMVTVFLAFVPSPVVFLKMVGVGMAAAILVDATLVRMVLVPATMELLGDRNWWLPGWLARRLPNVHVEGSVAELESVTSSV